MDNMNIHIIRRITRFSSVSNTVRVEKFIHFDPLMSEPTRPFVTLITVVEQDLNHADSFLGRFVEAIHYYSALFNSLGACYGEESEDRHVVEQQILSKEIRNVLAVGGPSRSGEVMFNNWREKLQQSGFRSISLAGNAAAQATLLLGMFPSHGYTLVEDNGTLKLGWKDLCLFTASAWRLNSSHTSPASRHFSRPNLD